MVVIVIVIVIVGMDVIAVGMGMAMLMGDSMIVIMGMIGVVDVVVSMLVIVTMMMMMVVFVDRLALDRGRPATADRTHHSTSNSATRRSSPPVI